MAKKILVKAGIVLGSVFGVIYALFLLLPFVVSPIIDGYAPLIVEEIQKATGLNAEIDDIRLVTTPKLTIGLKVGDFALITPDKKEIMRADDFALKMSLLPLLAKKIEIDLVSLNNLDLNLELNNDGSFEIEKYFPAQTSETKSQEASVPIELPFGLRLSNHLPNIKIGGYRISFTDSCANKSYDIKGNKTEISDFILNKSIKIIADGNVTLAQREQFKYNLNIHNKIMPDIELHDLIFNPQPQNDKDKNKEEFKINILNIFKGIYDNKITANIDGKLTLDRKGNSGHLKVDNMSVSPSGMILPPSDLEFKLSGHKININSHLYTAKDEISNLTGVIKTGKNTNLDITFKSNVELANVIKILNAIALTFDIKDLQTLSAQGKLDADFNIKSDLKKINSNGYIRVPSAYVNYGLYDVAIKDINADIALNNNNIDIKNIGFSILEQPLKLYGTISKDAIADLHLAAENLSLKGLMVACGQASLLKENPIYSGLVSLHADITGKADRLKPTAKVTLSNVDIKNIPADLRVKLPTTSVDLISDGKTFSGKAISNNIKLINPALSVSVPKVVANIKDTEIELAQTPIMVEKINLNLSGKIKNYMSEKIGLDFVTTGDIKSTLKGDMNVVKQTINLAFSAPETCTIIIPMFDKSELKFNGGVNITGALANPHLSGVFNVPSINIPEVMVKMENLVAKLQGAILNGNATVGKFISGGIVAENISTDFSMKGNDFYLKNLKGTAFDGKFNGNVVYNLSNAKTDVTLAASGMNAEKAIAGAAGIKNALSGILSFDTKLNLIVYPDYEKLMKSLGGKLSFKIEKGAFGKIGRFEHFLSAPNVINNTILKNTVSTISNLTGIRKTAEFAFISGSMNFSNGWANIDNIKSTGASISYFVSGKYNLVNGTANLVILGRLNNTIVKLLGPLGELSAEKILSYIPYLGNLTKSTAQSVTTDPDKEKTSELPALTDTKSGHKDFKVVYNGGIESTSSVKSFKWLTKSDTSALEQKSLTETVKDIAPSVKTDVQNTISGVKNLMNTAKTTSESLKSGAKNDLNTLKNLFK